MNKLLTTLFASTMIMASTNSDAQTYIGRQQPNIQNRRLTPEALWAMGRIGGADVKADGKSITYNVSYYSVEENKSHTVIYTINTDGTGEKNLTTDVASESAPRFLGDKITFISKVSSG